MSKEFEVAVIATLPLLKRAILHFLLMLASAAAE